MSWPTYTFQDSLRVIPSAYVDVSVKDSKVYANYQFERLGFFTVDKETTADKVSFSILTEVQIRKFYERKIVIIFLPINFNMCFGCSKDSSYRDSYFEYPQRMFWMRIKENSFPIHTLIWSPV